MSALEKDAGPYTHPMLTHPNGDQCIWLDSVGWFVPLDAGGDGYECPHDHPMTRVTPPEGTQS